MKNKRSIIIISIFLLATLIVLATSINVKRNTQSRKNLKGNQRLEEARFDGLTYYVLDNGKPSISLDATNLKIVENQDLYFNSPEGIIYDEKEEVEYKAKTGSFIGKTKELKLEGSVEVQTPFAGHKSEKLYYNGSKKYLEASGSVKSRYQDTKTKDNIFVTSNYVNSWMVDKRTLFLGAVKGKVKRHRIYEESFDFKANRVELNQLKSLVSLTENVVLERNNYHLEAQKAEIFLENFNKKLKYYVLYDDIKLEEKLNLPDGTTEIRRAFSEKLEGYMAEAKIVLSGAPRVEQGEDLIKGYQITLRENVELVEVDDSQSSFDLNKDK